MPGFVRPYTDNFHFRCEIYAELNRLLLDIVCPARAQSTTGVGKRQQFARSAVALGPWLGP